MKGIPAQDAPADWAVRAANSNPTRNSAPRTPSAGVSREHRRAKTDRLDTELLKRAFVGWLRASVINQAAPGQYQAPPPQSAPASYYPPPVQQAQPAPLPANVYHP